MDHSTKSMAEFATRLTFADLPARGRARLQAADHRHHRLRHCRVRRGALARGAGGGGAGIRAGRRDGDRHLASHAAGACRLRQQRRQPLSRRQRHLSRRRRPSRTTICCRSLRSRKPIAPARRRRSPRSCWPTRSTAICSAHSRCESTPSTMCCTTRSRARSARPRCWTCRSSRPPTRLRSPPCPISAPTSAAAAISPCGRAAPPPTPPATACLRRSWRRRAWPDRRRRSRTG